MENILIKKYLSERSFVYYNGIVKVDDLYQRYLNGHLNIDSLDFDIWLKRFDRNNLLFSHILKELGYVKNGDSTIELGCSYKHNVGKNLLQVEKQMMLDDKNLDNKKIDLNGSHLIMNGIYDGTMPYILSSIDKNDFSVGVCGYDCKQTRKLIAQYKAIKTYLLRTNMIKIDAIEENTDSKQLVYILNYNSNK